MLVSGLVNMHMGRQPMLFHCRQISCLPFIHISQVKVISYHFNVSEPVLKKHLDCHRHSLAVVQHYTVYVGIFDITVKKDNR